MSKESLDNLDQAQAKVHAFCLAQPAGSRIFVCGRLELRKMAQQLADARQDVWVESFILDTFRRPAQMQHTLYNGIQSEETKITFKVPDMESLDGFASHVFNFAVN
jgi:hypothetical protein